MRLIGGNDTGVAVLYHEEIREAPRGAMVRVSWPRKSNSAGSRN